MAAKLTERQRLVLAEAVADIDVPIPGRNESGPRWDGLALDIRNQIAARHRSAITTGFDKPGPMLSEDQILQIMNQLVDKGLLVVARGADYSKRVKVTDAGRAALAEERPEE